MLNINIGGYKGWKKFNPDVLKQWKIMDIDPRSDYTYDANSSLPFPLRNKTVNNYYSSMMIEHIAPANLVFFIREVHRTLMVGGIIRIVVPDICSAIQKYLAKDKKWLFGLNLPTPSPSYPPTILGQLIGWFYTEDLMKKGALRSGHKMVFDDETLNYYLKTAGFSNIKKMRYGEHSKIFTGKDFVRYSTYSLYVEATK